MNRRCDISRSKVIKNEFIELGEYIEVNKKILKVFAVFSKESSYYYLAKLYEGSNHYFLILESKQGTSWKFKVLNSFAGNKEGLEQTINVMYRRSNKDESYRGLIRIK